MKMLELMRRREFTTDIQLLREKARTKRKKHVLGYSRALGITTLNAYLWGAKLQKKITNNHVAITPIQLP